MRMEGLPAVSDRVHYLDALERAKLSAQMDKKRDPFRGGINRLKHKLGVRKGTFRRSL
jgi:hypothetical protein